MRIVLVEDDPNKGEQVCKCVKEAVPDSDVRTEGSYAAGLAAVISARPDLVILDMTMPTYSITGSESGGRPRAYAGRELLRELKRKEVDVPVLIITQFEHFFDKDGQVSIGELRASLRREFPDHFIGMVYYSAAQNSWRERVSKIARRISKTGKQ